MGLSIQHPTAGTIPSMVLAYLDGAGQLQPLADTTGTMAVVGSSGAAASSGNPYGADELVFTYYGSTNNVHTITYKLATVVLKTRTYSYVGSGTASNDMIIGVIDT